MMSGVHSLAKSEMALFDLLRGSPHFRLLAELAQIDSAAAYYRERAQVNRQKLKNIPVSLRIEDWRDAEEAVAHLKATGYPDLTISALLRIAIHLTLDELVDRKLAGEKAEMTRLARDLAGKMRSVPEIERGLLREALRKTLD
jgi:hypothetical protein